jgi:biopolymer transport protein TolR
MALVARRTGRRRRLMSEINVVPYVDVMLVLVVILMVAVPFVVPSVVELPTVERAGQQKDTPIRVVIRANGRMALLEGAAETPVAAAELASAVRQRQRGDPNVPVVVEADASVEYRMVMDAMRELQRAEFKRVGLSVVPATKAR